MPITIIKENIKCIFKITKQTPLQTPKTQKDKPSKKEKNLRP
jgi:hypothetical protein